MLNLIWKDQWFFSFWQQKSNKVYSEFGKGELNNSQYSLQGVEGHISQIYEQNVEGFFSEDEQLELKRIEDSKMAVTKLGECKMEAKE